MTAVAMRPVNLTLVILSGLLAGCASQPASPLEPSAALPAWRDRALLERDYPPHPESYWLELIAQVRLGMSRAEVEIILPSYSEDARMMATTIAGVPVTIEWYPVDRTWSIELRYDYVTANYPEEVLPDPADLLRETPRLRPGGWDKQIGQIERFLGDLPADQKADGASVE